MYHISYFLYNWNYWLLSMQKQICLRNKKKCWFAIKVSYFRCFLKKNKKPIYWLTLEIYHPQTNLIYSIFVRVCFNKNKSFIFMSNSELSPSKIYENCIWKKMYICMYFCCSSPKWYAYLLELFVCFR